MSAAKRIDRELLATAYHEAGHAVIAWVEDIPLLGASVIAGDGIDGYVRYANLLARDEPDALRPTKIRKTQTIAWRTARSVLRCRAYKIGDPES
jgi:hypothetical protein